MYRWLKSFLKERVICTRVGRAQSEARTLEEGLPQGSALSCTLFLAFINDLSSGIRTHKAMFADDMVIWTRGTDLRLMEQRLNRDLLTISAYCNLWKLRVNVDKTVYSVFTNGTKVLKYDFGLYMAGHRIAYEKAPRYLGVELDTRLTLQGHVQGIAEQATKRFGLIQGKGRAERKA